jgi:glycosyltransferase involved in cell wall biosynthesis
MIELRGGVSEPRGEVRLRNVLIVEQGGRGGVADYTGCLARALGERGVPVTIATAKDHRYGPSAGVGIAPIFAYVRGRSRVAQLARRVHLGRPLNGLRFLFALPALVRLARASSITHVQGWERASLGVVATLLLRAARVPIVYTAHNTFKRRAAAIDSARVFPALARATIVHTDADRARLSHPASVIPHGHYAAVADAAPEIDPKAARELLGLRADALVALLFGHLRTDKGLDDLLEAVARTPPWTAVVAGQEGGALAAAARRLASPELAGRVSVHEGFHDMSAVGRFFAAADVVVIPYHQASQSGVLHLAYGFARPVVVYPVGGLIEAVLPGETGWACAEPTPEALAAALSEAAALGPAELRRRGERGRRWARERFDWGRIAQVTQELYQSALDPPAPPERERLDGPAT